MDRYSLSESHRREAVSRAARPSARRKRPAPAVRELTALEVRLLTAKGLVAFFPEIIERHPVMAKHGAPTNGYQDIKMVETVGLKWEE